MLSSSSSTSQRSLNWSTPAIIGIVPEMRATPSWRSPRSASTSSQYCGDRSSPTRPSWISVRSAPPPRPQAQVVGPTRKRRQTPGAAAEHVGAGVLAPCDPVHLEGAVSVVAGDGQKHVVLARPTMTMPHSASPEVRSCCASTRSLCRARYDETGYSEGVVVGAGTPARPVRRCGASRPPVATGVAGVVHVRHVDGDEGCPRR